MDKMNQAYAASIKSRGAFEGRGERDWFEAGYKAALTPSPWIPCSERLPTESNSDATLKVWALGWDGSCHHIAYEYVCRGEHSHWKPTGLVRPEPPEVK